jgi:hypothetical protein
MVHRREFRDAPASKCRASSKTVQPEELRSQYEETKQKIESVDDRMSIADGRDVDEA